jgi:hypothetical protein
MKGMKKSLVVVCCVIVLCSLIAVPLLLKQQSNASNGEPQTTPQSTLQPTPSQSTPSSTPQSTTQPTPTSGSIQQAVAKATHYLTQTTDPYVLLMLNVLYRRFGITEFSDSLQRYDQLLAANPEPIKRIFRRIADYNNSIVQPSDFNSVTDEYDVLTVPALFSDRMGLPPDYPSMLIDAADRGGYLLTHVLLATIWLQDNNCEVPLPDNFVESLYQANAALAGNGAVITDLQIEAAAFLYMAGQGNLVSSAFVQRLIVIQNDDGGWSGSLDTPYTSAWHSSVLGLMVLLHVEFPAASYAPMLAPPPSSNSVGLNPNSVIFIIVWFLCLNYSRKQITQSCSEKKSFYNLAMI